jgi:hypothetical protein
VSRIPHRTHHPRRPQRRGSDGTGRTPGPATDGPGSVNAHSGQPSPIDPDLHANPIRRNGSDHARSPSKDYKSDADQAPTTKPATAKDKPEPRQPFSIIFIPHNIGLVLYYLTIHMIRDTIFDLNYPSYLIASRKLACGSIKSLTPIPAGLIKIHPLAEILKIRYSS